MNLQLVVLLLLPSVVAAYANTFNNPPPGWEATTLPGNCRFYHCRAEFPPAVCPVTGETPNGTPCQKSVLAELLIVAHAVLTLFFNSWDLVEVKETAATTQEKGTKAALPYPTETKVPTKPRAISAAAPRRA